MDSGAPASPPHGLRPAPEQREMALIAGLTLFLYLFAGTLLQMWHFRWGLVASQALFIAGPAILASRWFYLDRRAVFPLRRPPAAMMTGTLLGTASLNHLLTVFGVWQDRVFPVPRFFSEALAQLLSYRDPADFIALLLVFAVVPAVCEEILFRGFLQAGMVRALQSAPRGIALTALIFAFFHVLPQLYPGILALGLFVGYLAWRSGSLVPAMLAHGLNNMLSIVIGNAPGPVQQALQRSPVLGIGAAILFVASLLLVRRAPRRAAHPRVL